MLTQQDLRRSPLFEGIQHEEYMAMVSCFQAVRKVFRADELIYDLSNVKTDRIGIMERGEAEVIRVDEMGVSTVMEELGLGGVFGQSLAFAGSVNDSVQVVARTTCEVLFIDYSHIFKRCERACTHHSILVQNMLRLISDKADSNRVTLPFSFSTLADYIATDRSAMMRELKRLREEELIATDGRVITLLE